ncbi:MAG: hypothetical protein ABFD81_10225 [Syntrophaceae bacterium]
MNGEQYLEFEDWQTVGKFYEVSAKVVSTEFIDFGSAQGFLAKAEVIRLSDGMAISAAEAMCLNDEDKWSARSKYVYEYVLKDGTRQEDDPPKDMIVWVDNPDKPGKKMPQKERVLRGEVKVPLFQLRSMAQTRACAKALRNVLAWVVVLAGYKPTVAEELDGDTHAEENEPPKEPIKEPQKKTAPAAEETHVAQFSVKDVTSKSDEKNGKPYTIFTIFDEAGTKYGTFSDTFADLAKSAKESDLPVSVTYTTGKFGNKITNLEVVTKE